MNEKQTQTEFETVAIGVWYYAQSVQKKVALLRRPVTRAYSRWIEDETGQFVLNDAASIPTTPDGFVYYIGTTGGGEFSTIAEALAWADQQPWAPITWKFLSKE